tara:strand:+ start:527 stop:934 length:408 start_codon:yes stop_codon:yes gene_type:complete
MRYFLGISLVLNGVLMMHLFGILPFLFYSSVLLIVAYSMFVKYLLDQRRQMIIDAEDLVSKINNFSEHLERVYELEMFYGDETLESLFNHSRELVSGFYEYEGTLFESGDDLDTEEDQEEIIQGEPYIDEDKKEE